MNFCLILHRFNSGASRNKFLIGSTQQLVRIAEFFQSKIGKEVNEVNENLLYINSYFI